MEDESWSGLTHASRSALVTAAAGFRAAGFLLGAQSDVGPLERYIGYTAQQQPARWTLPLSTLAELDAASQAQRETSLTRFELKQISRQSKSVLQYGGGKFVALFEM